MRRLGVHVLAGIASSAVAIVCAVLATPLYLRFLGADSYGVLAFVLVLQAALYALDGGIGVSINRAIAQVQGRAGRGEIAPLVAALERVCWLVAVAIIALLAILAPLLARHWLRLGPLDADVVTEALVLGGIMIGVRWPQVLYQGILIGAQRVPALSLVISATTIAGAIGAVAVAAWRGDVRWVFGVLAAIALAQTLACRVLVAGEVPGAVAAPRADVGRFVAAAAAAGWLGLVGLLIMQIDKVVLSKLLSIAQFGYYSMAALMAASLYTLVSPVFNVLYPQLSAQVTERPSELEGFYRNSSLALGAVVFPPAAAIAVFGESILLLWTGDAVAAATAGPVVRWLAFGTALHGIMSAPFALKMACGRSKLALGISSSVLAVTVPLIVGGAWYAGATGAAAAWFAANVVYLLGGSLVTHRWLLPGVHVRWLVRDVAPPLLVALLFMASVAALVPATAWSPLARTLLAAVAVVACWIGLIGLSPRLRNAARTFLAGTGSP